MIVKHFGISRASLVTHRCPLNCPELMSGSSFLFMRILMPTKHAEVSKDPVIVGDGVYTIGKDINNCDK